MTALADRLAAASSAAPLCELSADQRAELSELLASATDFEDLPGKWQAAVLESELRAAGEAPARGHCGH